MALIIASRALSQRRIVRCRLCCLSKQKEGQRGNKHSAANQHGFIGDIGGRRFDHGANSFQRQTAPAFMAGNAARFLSAAALTLLIYAAVTIGLPQLAQAALILFLLAASGGVLLNLNYHLKMVPLPKWMVLAHAGIAIIGFLLLLAATWSASHS
ncbi:hypothetical protein ACFQAT_12800 [Undibacterium arcticum]|uniref:hypothetical protein n=1 Tax=Undibacterium arcticum TaxID=1762892 RepID=UPI00360857BB